MKYYIVGNKAFKNKNEAETYCQDCDFDPCLIVEAMPTKIKYYELQTTCNNTIYYNQFLTSEELESKETEKYIKNLRNGEYCSRLVHLKEISKEQYIYYTA